MHENWEVLTSFFPEGWRQIGRSCGAVSRLRGFRSEDALMQTLLLHVAQGYSLRETTTVARAAGLAHISDVALLKRFKQAGPWFRELSLKLLMEAHLPCLPASGLTMCLVDATHVKEPGKTGSCWRIHYALALPSLACRHFSLTATSGPGVGESFRHFPVTATDCLIGDRGYSSTDNVASVSDRQGCVLIRYNPFLLALYTAHGKRMDIARLLARWPARQQSRMWRCAVEHPKGGMIAGRLLAIRKSQTAAAAATKRALRQASRKQYSLKRPVLEYAKYIMVFTTLPEDRFDTELCLEWYRVRWQIELVFKRFKSLAGLGHLPKHDPESSQAWLYGKLFTGLLTEKLIQYGESISPWGYGLASSSPPGEPVA